MNIEVKNLHAGINDVKILHGVDISLVEGSLNVLMGPNGSGKSTIANVIMGNPSYVVSEGSILADGTELLEIDPHQRAKMGLFMSFQDPVEFTGVTVGRFLRRAYEVIHGEVPPKFVQLLRDEIDKLGMDQQFINRYLNDGFSGGEKKRMELYQARVLKPKVAILDEIDSGLDIDAIRVIAQAINDMRRENPSITIVVVTHYRRIVDHLESPNQVYVMSKGKIVQKGTVELLDKLEQEGYGWLRKGEQQ